MIKGIGIDIVDTARIADMVRKYGDHFLKKVFTSSEITFCTSTAQPHIHFSGRWAAKEAFYKSLPESIQPYSFWKSVEIVSSKESRRPELVVIDKKLAARMKKAKIGKVHLSISHEKAYCVAYVIAE
jgi:holo-[acyl-carrier protein] synthase